MHFAACDFARWSALLAGLILLSVAASLRADAVAGQQRAIAFDRYAPLSRSSELMRRILSPLMLARLQETLARSGQGVSEQSIDLAQERFDLYVPPTRPAGGYALLVFVPPWEDARFPPQWIDALDKHGMILVTAAKSGNAVNVIDRREPLALTAAYNAMHDYAVDASRVYVGGFSGGSHVALRLALAYPDLFRGALLEAGSDPIGDSQIAIPDAALFRRFAENSRIVYFTGRDDAERLDQDTRSMRSLREWCVANIDDIVIPWSGHETADARSFARALEALESGTPKASSSTAACLSRIENDVSARLGGVASMVARGDVSSATKALEKIDVRFGGLAAPRSVELMKEIASHRR